MEQLIIASARDCLGTPFVHQGRIKGVGMDCAGLIVHVLESLGKPHTDLRGYPRLPYRHMLENHLDAQPCFSRVSELKPGCVLLLRILHHPQHLAIWTGTSIVHAYSDAGRVVEHRIDAAWRKKISRIYEIV